MSHAKVLELSSQEFKTHLQQAGFRAAGGILTLLPASAAVSLLRAKGGSEGAAPWLRAPAGQHHMLPSEGTVAAHD